MTRFVTAERFEYETPDGEVFKLDAGLRCVMSFTGLGMPNIAYNTTRAPGQHGETATDFRYQSRIVQLLLREDTSSRFEYWEARERLVNILRPDRQDGSTFNPGKFRVIRPDGQIRVLRVHISNGPAFSARNADVWDEWGFTEVIRLIAHDPLFWGDTEQSFSVGPVEVAAPTNLTFPITFRSPATNPAGTGIQFYAGAINFSITGNLTYAGSYRTFPRIVIDGPVSGPVIRNNTLGLELRPLIDVGAGDTLTIYLDPGHKRVISSRYGDVSGALAPGNDLAGFRLEPHPRASGSINQIQFSGSGAEDGVTDCTLHYYERFVGM